MKTKIALIALLTAASISTAHAGIAEKKAMKKAEATVAAATAAMQTACGNVAVSTKFNWDQFHAIIDANKAAIEKDGDKGQFIIDRHALRTEQSLEALAAICKDDEDYKAEIAKITEIVVTPQADFTDANSEFALEGTVVTISSGFKYARSIDDFVPKLKAMY